MLLRSLEIVDLHGSLNQFVNFNEDITLLIGINGSGKTSVLNVIDWLLGPDLKRLALTNYRRLTLTFHHDDALFELSALKTTKVVTISVKADAIKVEPITITLHLNANPEYEEDGPYDNLAPEPGEMPMWELLKSFTKPIVITLDRSISAEADERVYIDNPIQIRQKKNRSKSPLNRVQEVTSSKFAQYRAKSIQHDNELKARIVMSALQSPEEIFSRSRTKRMSRQELEHLETKVIKYLSSTIKTEDVSRQVRDFFNASKQFSLRPSSKDPVLDFLNNQYRQVEGLAKAFNDFEVKNATAFKELRVYLNAVNEFFKDSNKRLYFNESTGILVFSYATPNGTGSTPRPISQLSSGEKQILILFTFLAFIAKPESVFIVDEPELSLHPKWQHEFMELFLHLRPENTQLLLATHSPDIVGRFKSSCVSLKGQASV